MNALKNEKPKCKCGKDIKARGMCMTCYGKLYRYENRKVWQDMVEPRDVPEEYVEIYKKLIDAKNEFHDQIRRIDAAIKILIE